MCHGYVATYMKDQNLHQFMHLTIDQLLAKMPAIFCNVRIDNQSDQPQKDKTYFMLTI